MLHRNIKLGLIACAFVLIALLAGCADVEDDRAGGPAETGQQTETCGRIDAAAANSIVPFKLMGKLAKDCENGDLFACNPANYVMAPIIGVIYAPFGFLIGLTSSEVENYHCGKNGQTEPSETIK